VRSELILAKAGLNITSVAKSLRALSHMERIVLDGNKVDQGAAQLVAVACEYSRYKAVLCVLGRSLVLVVELSIFFSALFNSRALGLYFFAGLVPCVLCYPACARASLIVYVCLSMV
jgi:hypothetical protein